jgi:hypothetical protein
MEEVSQYCIGSKCFYLESIKTIEKFLWMANQSVSFKKTLTFGMFKLEWTKNGTWGSQNV